MSVIAITFGFLLPIINLIATLIFFLGNLKASRFVRWHCTQALLSQIAIAIVNIVGVTWSLRIIYGNLEVTNYYFSYLITIFTFNVFQFIITIYAAVVTRKGRHIEWWVFGPLTNVLFGELG